MKFEFATATQIVFGAGAVRDIGARLTSFGRRALVVTGCNAGRADPLLADLKAKGMGAVCFSVVGEPEISTVERGVAFAKGEECDVVIGIGGGSVLDAAKAMAAMLTNEGAVQDYLEIIGGGKALVEQSAPFVAIPTTAGTGSEVTRNAVLASPEHRLKVSLRSPLMLARVAVVDPELTYDLPPGLTASIGLDALTQLIEPYVCLRANAMTDGLCVEGMRRAARSLRDVCANGEHKAAREDMSVASLFGGLALANAGLGAVHGFAGPIGGMFAAPHGAVCAALLPHVMAANVRALKGKAEGGKRKAENPDTAGALQRYDEVARLLTGRAQAVAEDGVRWVGELVSDLGIARLGSYGITAADIGEIVEKSQQASSMKANPVKLTAEELAEVLREAI